MPLTLGCGDIALNQQVKVTLQTQPHDMAWNRSLLAMLLPPRTGPQQLGKHGGRGARCGGLADSLQVAGLPALSLCALPALSVSDLCYLASLIGAFSSVGKPFPGGGKAYQQIGDQGFQASLYQEG